MFAIKSYREWTTPEMSMGDVLELERLANEAHGLYGTLRRKGERTAVQARLKVIDREARNIKARWA